MRYLKLVAAIAFAFSVSANAQGDEVFYRNVCDTLASKGHAPVTLAASAIAEYNWNVTLKSGTWKTGTWNYGTQKTTFHDSYSSLNLIVTSSKYRFPYSVEADCREMDNVVFNYLMWNKAWKADSLEYATYIYDTHAMALPDYDSTNANNLLVMTGNPPIDGKETFEAGEILVSKPYEFAFEWWFVGMRYGLGYMGGIGHDSLAVLNSLVRDVKSILPDTLETLKVQVVKVVLKDVIKSESIEPLSSSSSVMPSSSSQSSSSFEPPKSCSPTKSSDSKPSSSSFDPPKSCSPTKSSDSKPSSSSKDESSASTPSSDSDKTSDSKASSSSKGPKGSSSSDKTSIEMVRMELVDDEVVEMRTLDGSLVKNSRNVKPGIYYAKTSRGTWFKKVILPRGE
ncbi:hypothetical protein [uncultured Fibrobacter sp.]|uniref:hypothetical protein n=1 Tax=uncultured Fibrobacter sp. TaxID=261512 RepID=UPI0025E5B0C1|nr:hypothetical protein [uncultured Fibrobacter sp.]